MKNLSKKSTSPSLCHSVSAVKVIFYFVNYPDDDIKSLADSRRVSKGLLLSMAPVF